MTEWKKKEKNNKTTHTNKEVLFTFFYTVKSVLTGHPRNQNSVAVQDRWPFMTDRFHRECTAEGQKQNGR
jgi:hypothetical protein